MRTVSSAADVIPKSPQLVKTPDTNGPYPRLSDDQIATLKVGGSRRPTDPGARAGRFLGELQSWLWLWEAGTRAGQPTVFLASRGNPVHLLIRSKDLGRSVSRYLVDQIPRNRRVAVHLCTEVREACGDTELKAVVAEDKRTGCRFQINTRSLFVFVGAVPNTSWLSGVITLDDHGFISTGADARQPRHWAPAFDLRAPPVASGNQSAWCFRRG
jgi:hypothetical protein